ncbi:MAG: electron transfer flavoprotein subunit beta/FixA family protein [Desulfotignum sp.]|nr:electron transfer flavoprotein subunit beta/FixA family protein [Desulfotignum sp.]
MLHIIVCIKQVPMVSELPWDAKTGTLKRETAQGMMDPSSRRALEAALQIKADPASGPVRITVVSMGPPMAKEVLYEARALGADQGVLLTDSCMAGADTCMTAMILGAFIRNHCPDAGLILCGSMSSDSETAQVGPQLAEELDIPAIGYARRLELGCRCIRVARHVDDFMELMEMDLPGLVTIDHAAESDRYAPRYVTLGGVEAAFNTGGIQVMDGRALGLEKEFNALKASPTKIMEVYSPLTQKEGRVLTGAVKKMVDTLFDDYGKIISSAMGKDLKTHDHEEDL